MAGTERPVGPTATAAAGKYQLPVLLVVSGTCVVGAGIAVAGAGTVVPADGVLDWLSDFPQPASSAMPINATGAITLIFITSPVSVSIPAAHPDQVADDGAECSEASRDAYTGTNESNSVPKITGFCNQALTSCLPA
jgi:hypothetical protein